MHRKRWSRWTQRLALHSAVCCLLSVASARAEDDPSVALIGVGSPEFERQLAAEGRAVGVVLLRPEPTQPAQDLIATGSAVAVIEVLDASWIRLWIEADAPDGARDMRRADDEEPEAFALRVVEQLRAQLLELDVRAENGGAVPAPSRKQAAETPPPPAKPARSPGNSTPTSPGDAAVRDATGPGNDASDRLWVQTGIGGLGASGSMGGTVSGLLGIRFEPGRIWSVSGLALLPITQNELVAPEGKAEVRITLVGAGVNLRLTAPTSRFGAHVGAGAGAVILGMRGEATAPFEGLEARSTAGIFFLDGTVSARLAPWLRASGRMMAGLSAPRPVVQFAGRDVAAWGRLYGALLAGLELGVPVGGQP